MLRRLATVLRERAIPLETATMRPTAIIIFAVISSLFAIQTNAFAQLSGNVSGVVKEESGAVLRGVTVEVENPTLIEEPRRTVADSMGHFQLTDVLLSIYTATFSLAGFRTRAVRHCVVEYLQVVDGTGRSETFRDVTISFRDTRFQTKTSGWRRGGRMSDAIEPHGLR